MKKIKSEKPLNYRFLLTGLTPENLSKVYMLNFHRWLFDNSDEVWIDGELSPFWEKKLIKATFYDIRPKPKEIKVSRKQNGFPLSEEVFIKEEINRYELIYEDTIGSKEYRTLNQKASYYLNFLKEKEKKLNDSLPEHPEEIEISNVPLYPQIFKNNAFVVWESMFEEFKITESSRSDVKFIFEEMKKDGLIHKNVSQRNFLDWISDTYNLEIEKTSNYNRTKERISIYSTAKRLYKN